MVKKMKEKHDWLAVILEKKVRDNVLKRLMEELAEQTGKKELLFSPYKIGNVEVLVFHGTERYITRVHLTLQEITQRAIGLEVILIDKEGVVEVRSVIQ